MDIFDLKVELLQFARWRANRIEDGKTLIQQVNIYIDEVVLPQANVIKSVCKHEESPLYDVHELPVAKWCLKCGKIF